MIHDDANFPLCFLNYQASLVTQRTSSCTGNQSQLSWVPNLTWPTATIHKNKWKTYVSCPCAPYEGTWARRGIAPLINLGTIGRWLVKLHSPASLPLGKQPLHCYYRLGWPQSQSRCDGKVKELLNLPGIETRLHIKYKRKYTNLLLSPKDQVTNECVYGGRGKDSGTFFYIYCSVHHNILSNNQQMQLYAVNFIPLLSSLYMFRAAHTPIIRSTKFNCIYSHCYNHRLA